MSAAPAADRIRATTPEEARDRFLRFLRQSLRAVSETATWIIVPVEGDVFAAVTSPEVLRLKTVEPGRSLYLWSTIRFTVGEHDRYDDEFKVYTEDYVHTLSWEASLHEEICSWQWDPTGWDDPHVHVHRRVPSAGSLGKLHIPTARVTFEQVLRFAFRDFDALPNRKLGDTDAERLEKALALLDDSHRRVQTYGRGRR